MENGGGGDAYTIMNKSFNKKKKTVRLRKGNNKDDDEMKETSTGFQRQENILSETMKSD